MARPPRKLHELRPVLRKNSTYVHYRRKWWPLGPWDARNAQPSAAAEEKLAKLKALWRADPTAGTVRADDPLLVELWADWRASPHCPPDRRDELSRCGRALFGTAEVPGPHLLRRASEFGPPELLGWQDALCAERKRLAGDGAGEPTGPPRYGRYTVQRYVALVRQCYSWGVAKGLVDAGQATSLAGVPAPPGGGVREAVEREGATEGQVAACVARLKGRAGDAVRLLWLTGARPSELCRLTAGQVRRAGVVRPKKGEPVDLAAAGVWAAPLAAHKTRRKGGERCLFFGPLARAVLEPLLAGKRPGEFVLTTANGSPYTSRVLNRALKLAGGRAGVGPLTPYQLRHGCGQRVQAAFSSAVAGSGHLAAAAYLGHTVPGMTGRYAGVDWVTAAAVARRCG
jgi:integrase